MSKATNDLICLSHLRWGFVYQRPNHLMSRFARERRVFFVEEPVFEEGRARAVTREESPNLWVVVPHLPNGLSAAQIARDQRRLLDAMIRDHDVRDPILWFYTPMALGFAGHLEAATVVYDCMDELSAFRGAPPSFSSGSGSSWPAPTSSSRGDIASTSRNERSTRGSTRFRAASTRPILPARGAGRTSPTIRPRYRTRGSVTSVSSTSASTWP